MSVDLTDSKSVALHVAAREYAIKKAKERLIQCLDDYREIDSSTLIDDVHEEIVERIIRTFNCSMENYIITGGSID